MKKTTLLFLMFSISTLSSFSQEKFFIDGAAVVTVGNNLTNTPATLYTEHDFENEGSLTFFDNSQFYVDSGLISSASLINFNDATLHLGSGDGTRSSSSDSYAFVNRTPLPATDPVNYATDFIGQTVRFVVLNKDGGTVNVNQGHLGITDTFTSTLGTLNGETTVTLLHRSNTKSAVVLPSTEGTVNIEIERFISANAVNTAIRGFRFYAPAVTSSQSIREQLQEGATSRVDNPVRGFGTHITGVDPNKLTNAPAETDNAANGGLDWQPSGDASLFTWETDNQRWSSGPDANPLLSYAPPVTDPENFNVHKAYRIMVRGDRSIDIQFNEDSTTGTPQTPTSTVLRSRGGIEIGDTSILNLATGAGQISFVANPYASFVNYSSVTKTNLTNYIAIWDYKLNGGLGAFVTIDGTNTGGAPEPLGTGNTNVLQPGQSFFVRNTAAGNPTLLFPETSRTTGTLGTSLFSDLNYLNLRLESTDYEYVVDGLGLRFNNSFNEAVDDSDAGKLENPSTNFAIINGSNLLAIDHRPAPIVETTVPLLLTDYDLQNYRIIPTMNFDGLENMEVYFKDNYLNSMTLIEESMEAITFNVDETIPASINPYRFELVFNPTTLSTDVLDEGFFTLYPNPATSQVSIVLPNNATQDNWDVSLYSVTGQLIGKWKHENVSNSISVEIGNLESGVYLVELSNKEQKSVQKLIKK